MRNLPLIRGGQTLFHSIHMFSQVLGYMIVSFMLVTTFATMTLLFMNTNADDRYFFTKWTQAEILDSFNSKATLSYRKVKVTAQSFLLMKSSQLKWKTLSQQLIHSLKIGICCGFLVVIALLIWFRIRGFALSKSQIKEGRFLSNAKTLVAQIKSVGEISTIQIAKIPLFLNTECQHILIHGSSGTGKSVIISDLLSQIRNRGDKAIIYDKHGSFVSHFYSEERDILLNPMDKRCEAWHVWAECKQKADYEQLAASFIPQPIGASDPFWINSARSLFAAVAFNMRHDPDKSLKKLLHVLMSSDIKLLQKYVKGSEAESLMSEQVEKTALSIKSVLANYIKPLHYLRQDQEAFSIRNWLTKESDEWLFVTSLAHQHQAIKPLISSWLDIAVNQLLALDINLARRIWFIFDELPSLQKLPCLSDALAESRKFGGCIVLGLQNIFQLHEHYSQDGTKALVDLCNTKVFLRAPSNQCAEWVAKEIGMQEVLEAREGISYGAHHVRDGVSMQQTPIKKPVMTSTELMNLPDLNAIVCIPPIKSSKPKVEKIIKCWPVARCKIDVVQRSKLSEPFLLLDKEELPLQMEEVKSKVDYEKKLSLKEESKDEYYPM